MGELAELRNIGFNEEKELNAVGIDTCEDLEVFGAKAAWLKLKTRRDSTPIDRLYALEGALENKKISKLSPETKADLKRFYDTYK